MDVGDKVNDERVAFEAWAKPQPYWWNGQTYSDLHTQVAWEAWQAARRTPSASIGEDGLPELPEVRAIRAGNSFPKVYALAYTADQMREYASEAVAADRQSNNRQMIVKQEARAHSDAVASVIACAQRVHAKFGAGSDWSEWRDLGNALAELARRTSAVQRTAGRRMMPQDHHAAMMQRQGAVADQLFEDRRSAGIEKREDMNKVTAFERREGAIIGYAFASMTPGGDQVIVISPDETALQRAAELHGLFDLDMTRVKQVEVKAAPATNTPNP